LSEEKAELVTYALGTTVQGSRERSFQGVRLHLSRNFDIGEAG